MDKSRSMRGINLDACAKTGTSCEALASIRRMPASRHSQRLSDASYYKRWLLKNATAQNLRNSNRPPITLPRVAFMERPELFPEI